MSKGCLQRLTALRSAGHLKNVRLTTEVRCLFKDEKFILMFKRVPSARTKAERDMQPIAPTSSPTIGNTLVSSSRSACEAVIVLMKDYLCMTASC